MGLEIIVDTAGQVGVLVGLGIAAVIQHLRKRK
jgi:hypothetical protein